MMTGKKLGKYRQKVIFAHKQSLVFTATNFNDSHKLTLTSVYFSEPGKKYRKNGRLSFIPLTTVRPAQIYNRTLQQYMEI